MEASDSGHLIINMMEFDAQQATVFSASHMQGAHMPLQMNCPQVLGSDPYVAREAGEDLGSDLPNLI